MPKSKYVDSKTKKKLFNEIKHGCPMKGKEILKNLSSVLTPYRQETAQALIKKKTRF